MFETIPFNDKIVVFTYVRLIMFGFITYTGRGTKIVPLYYNRGTI